MACEHAGFAAPTRPSATVCAVIVAGGSGTRFGNPGGKQLVNVAGRPLMTWSVMAFDRSVLVGHIVVVCPHERRAEVRRLAIEPFGFTTPISFADAGETRQDSTAAGVDAVPIRFAGSYQRDDTGETVAVEAVLPSDTTRVGAPVSGDGTRRAK